MRSVDVAPAAMKQSPAFMPARTFALAITALVALSCGTLASQSTGDVDLPLSFVGPFTQLQPNQTPHMTSTLIVPADSSQTLDEPSVIVPPGGYRVAFVTLTGRDGHSVIGRASEMMPTPPATTPPPRSLSFSGAAAFLAPMLPWEGASVRSPGAYLGSDGMYVLVYAGDGGIGLATSTDGNTFTRMPSPILTPQSMDGGNESLAQPSIAANPAGGWLVTFQANGSLWIARSMSLAGPWQRDPQPILSPAMVAPEMADASVAFDNVALGDPAITVLTTPANRTLYVVFYTAQGTASANSVIGAVASFDAVHWSRVGHPLYSERLNAVRAGSFELLDSRTALLWIGTGPATSRAGSAAIGPVVPRVQITQY